MEPAERNQNRFIVYNHRLIDLCESVRTELDRNREKRSQWHEKNSAWKKEWLKDPIPQSPNRPKQRDFIL